MSTYMCQGELMPHGIPEWAESPISYSRITKQTLMPDSFFRDYPKRGNIIKCTPTLDPDRGLTLKFIQETAFRDPEIQFSTDSRVYIHLNYLSPYNPASCRDFVYLEDRVVIVHFGVQPAGCHPLSACVGFQQAHEGKRSETQLDVTLQPRLPAKHPHGPNLWDAVLISVINIDEPSLTDHYLVDRPSDSPHLWLYRVQL